jgi:hypothetical protein
VVGITISGVFTSVVLHSKFGLALWQPLLALPVVGTRPGSSTRALSSVVRRLGTPPR